MSKRIQTLIERDFPNKGTYNLSDFEISEKDKNETEYLILKTDEAIQRLVNESSYRREQMFKMRDFYDGIRDPREFAFLEDNYGTGNPASIKFTPLIRNRIDALVGLLSSTQFDYTAAVTDFDSLFKAEQSKAKNLFQSILSEMEKQSLDIQEYREKDPEGKELAEPKASPIDQLVETVKKKQNQHWRNVFVQAAIDFIENAKENPAIGLAVLRRVLFEDIAVVGECIYRTVPGKKNTQPKPVALLPENCYYEINREEQFINRARDFVHVRYMSKRDALQLYGHQMNYDEMKEVLEMETIRLSETMLGYYEINGIKDGPNNPNQKRAIDRQRRFLEDKDVIRVYEVEWVANNEYTTEDGEIMYRQDLYQSTRLGENVYVDMGKADTIIRYEDDPDKAYLSFNGTRYSSRGGDAYSILWKCKDIQDQHDILLFHRDNLVANSGTRGITLDFSRIPEFYGDDEMERAMKALSLIKQGLNLTDNTQEGAEASSGNGFGTYDLTVNGESLSAINETLDQLDGEATKITGVTPQMLGAIEQREAVSNVKTGISHASLVLKGLYDHHDMVMKSLLENLINYTKESMTGPIYGTHSNGRRIFTILPENFSFTNYRINVVNSSQEKLKLDEGKAIIASLANTGNVSPTVALKSVFANSPQEMLQQVLDDIKENGDQSAEIQQLQKTVEELQKQLEKAGKEIENHQKRNLDLEEKKFNLENRKVDHTLKQGDREIARKEKMDDNTVGLKKDQLRLEEDQLYLASSGNSAEVRNL